MAETLAAGPPAPGPLSLDTAYLSNNFASLAGTNTAAQAGATAYSYSAYSYSPPGGTVQVPGLSEGALNGNKNATATGWAALSDTVKYVIYAAAGVVGLAIIGIVIWLLVRKSKKRKEQEARQNARLTTRSSFASPMHERETMQPQSANAFTFNDPHGSMGDYAEKQGSGGGVYRTETNYTNGSVEKSRGVYADAQSVHSIPPAYSHGGQGNRQQNNHNNNYNSDNNAGNMSGATLLNASTSSHPSEDGNNAPVHHMLANVNTSLSSFKPVPPAGSKPAAMPRVEEPSYPPRLQSHNATMGQQERSGTPSSARRQQQNQQQRQQYSPRDQYQQQQQQSYSRNAPSNQQQYSNHSRNVPPSPAYSQSTLASARNRYDDDFASPQGYFTPSEQTPTSPYAPALQQPSQAAISPPSGAGHRYRMPPQNRQRAQSPPINPAAAYQNPYAAFADDGDVHGSYPAGQGQGGYSDYRADPRQQQYRQQQQQQQQYQQPQYDASDSYFPAQSRHQPQQQENYPASYDNYRQY